MTTRMKRVIVESPFKGEVERNKLYLERCLRDCIMRGESPYASHKMLTDCLDDDDPKEREMGISAGYAWWTAGDLVVFYVDFGWSGGMTRAWERCRKEGIPYETRTLPADAEYVRVVREEKEREMEEKIEACARAAYEANRAYCLALNDTSQPSWEDAAEWQRRSVLNGVRGVLDGNTPEQSHEGWLAEKKATGWKYGPVKDPEKREHPCFVPYDELSEEQRQKDHIFVGVVSAMARALGLEIKGAS